MGLTITLPPVVTVLVSWLVIHGNYSDDLSLCFVTKEGLRCCAIILPFSIFVSFTFFFFLVQLQYTNTIWLVCSLKCFGLTKWIIEIMHPHILALFQQRLYQFNNNGCCFIGVSCGNGRVQFWVLACLCVCVYKHTHIYINTHTQKRTTGTRW
jgi:hypothetical protein